MNTIKFYDVNGKQHLVKVNQKKDFYETSSLPSPKQAYQHAARMGWQHPKMK